MKIRFAQFSSRKTLGNNIYYCIKSFKNFRNLGFSDIQKMWDVTYAILANVL